MITSSANKVIAAGNGAQTVFAFSFVGAAAGDIYAIYTDANGNETVLTQGPGPTQYQVSLNAASAGSIWGIGGAVTYNPGGTPIANNTTLTIFREVAYVQDVSLQNQASFGQYAAAAEEGLDLLEMQIQQIAEAQTRVISAPIVDPDTINLVLPAAAQRASQVLGFDSTGNVIAVSTLPAGTVSSAMQPVVDASTLANARSALGLGTMAVENIGAGLQDDGAGDARVVFIPAADATNQTVTAAFHLTDRHASGTLTYNNPKASTLFPGFGYYVSALSAAITLAINGADSFSGANSGQSLIIPPGTQVYISTDGTATWFVRQVQAIGYDSPLNLQINAAVSSGNLTISLADRNGNAPSTASPVILAFRDPTAANGDPVIRAISSSLSIEVPNGATLGTANSTPFRLWVVLFDNNGSPVLGVFQSVTLGSGVPTTIAALDEASLPSPAAISTASDSAGTFYAASALAGKAFRILGYLNFSSGQAVAGDFVTAPDRIQLFGVGIKKPGDTVGSVFVPNGSNTSTANTYAMSNTAPTIAQGALAVSTGNYSPSFPGNVLDIEAQAVIGNSGSASAFTTSYLYNGAAVVAVASTFVAAGAAVGVVPVRSRAVAGAGAADYSLYFTGSTGTSYLNSISTTAIFGGKAATFIELTELMV